MEKILTEKPDLIDKTKYYYVYCKSGWRAVLAISILAKLGYFNTICIPGFEDGLEKSGLPIIYPRENE